MLPFYIALFIQIYEEQCSIRVSDYYMLKAQFSSLFISVKLLRSTLESLRKRILSTLTVSMYQSDTVTPDDLKKDQVDVPFFAADFILKVMNSVRSIMVC